MKINLSSKRNKEAPWNNWAGVANFARDEKNTWKEELRFI
jgi:hypothetical protein